VSHHFVRLAGVAFTDVSPFVTPLTQPTQNVDQIQRHGATGRCRTPIGGTQLIVSPISHTTLRLSIPSPCTPLRREACVAFSAGFLCCYIPITAKPTTRGFVVTEKIVRELILANKFTRDLFGKKYLVCPNGLLDQRGSLQLFPII